MTTILPYQRVLTPGQIQDVKNAYRLNNRYGRTLVAMLNDAALDAVADQVIRMEAEGATKLTRVKWVKEALQVSLSDAVYIEGQR